MANVIKMSKPEKFIDILRKISFPNQSLLNEKKIAYIFEIPETKIFFDWFMSHVDQECFLTRNEIDRFRCLDAKGQVIWDLNRLENINSLVSLSKSNNQENEGDMYEEAQAREDESTTDESIESLRRDIEHKEYQLKLLESELEFDHFATRSLSENLTSSKQKKHEIVSIVQKLIEKETFVKNSTRSVNQNLNRLFTEFQVKFGDEDKLAQLVCTTMGGSNSYEGDSVYENYLAAERVILNKVKSLSFVEVDCASYSRKKANKQKPSEFNSIRIDTECDFLHQSEKSIIDWISADTTDYKENENNENILKLFVKKYPSVMEQWFSPKLEQEYSRCNLDLLNHILANKHTFFEYNQQQLQTSPHYMQLIEENIRQNERMAEELRNDSSAYSTRIFEKIHRLTNLKTITMINHHMCLKKIDLTAFYNKQDRLVRCMNNQRLRVNFFAYMQKLKLDDLDYLKQTLGELVAENHSMANTNQQFNNSMMLTTSFSAVNNNVMRANTTNAYSKQQKALLSSTMAPMQQQKSMQTALNLSSISSQQSNLISDDFINESQYSAFIQLINQFLIASLTKFHTELENDEADEHLPRLKRPISVQFVENSDTYIDFNRKLDDYCQKNASSASRLSKLNSLFKLVQQSIEYLYDKDDEKSTCSFAMPHQSAFNLNKLNIRMVKSLHESLEALTERTVELENSFVSKVFKKLHNYKARQASDGFYELRRNFFLYFFNTPNRVDAIIDELNQI